MNGEMVKEKKVFFSFFQKVIIVSLLLVFFVILLLIVFLPKKGNKIDNKNISRTIMIYMVGSDLESKSSIATHDLDAIESDKVDLDNINVLLYTGGTELWHNFIKNDENAIYKLTSDGFEKIETYKKLNMGDPATFADFLTYSYNNYKADVYDLILYDHGGAIHGAIYDDFSDDNLSLSDFSEALDKSPFDGNNKISTVLFRTCLNGTLEVANTFKGYADYLVASEEVSYGNKNSKVFGFLNGYKSNDSEYNFGYKFIQNYDDFIKNDGLDLLMPYTYSIIDLSKVDLINSELNNFIKTINVSNYYQGISKVRGSMYQFAYTAADDNRGVYYDTVDLLSLISSLSEYSDYDTSKLENAVKDSILYNLTNIKDVYGLSIYFPYQGNTKAVDYFFNVYKEFDDLDSYYSFISAFNAKKNGESGKKVLDFSKNTFELSSDGGEVSYQLSEEQIQNYASSIYSVFRKDENNPGYYIPIYTADNAVISSDGKLETKIGKNAVKVVFDDGEDFLYVRRNNIGDSYKTTVTVFKKDPWDYRSVDLLLKNENGLPTVASAIVKNEDEDGKVSGVLVDLNDYDSVQFWNFSYKILDDKGKYIGLQKSADTKYGYEDNINNVSFKFSDFNDGGEYYCVFIIKDVNGDTYYSDFIRMGN